MSCWPAEPVLVELGRVQRGCVQVSGSTLSLQCGQVQNGRPGDLESGMDQVLDGRRVLDVSGMAQVEVPDS